MMKSDTNLARERRLIGDNPKKQDELGHGPYAKVLAKFIMSPSLETPFTVGIFGPWGTGKSTFMYNLANILEDSYQDKSLKVTFEPWQFQEREEVWKALLLTVLQDLEALVVAKFGREKPEVRRIFGTIQKLTLGVAKIAFDKILEKTTAGIITVDDVSKAYHSTAQDNTRFINTFSQEFKNLVEEIFKILDVSKKEGRIFVYIDDLDRCTPDNAMMVLEAIKLFFDLKGCVFIVGIDKEIVQRGIELKYDQHKLIKGQDYLDKMIQLPFSLPPINPDRFLTYARNLIMDSGISDETLKLLVRAAQSNPRKLKRLINSYSLVVEVSGIDLDPNVLEQMGGTADHSKIAFLLTLQVSYPVIFAIFTTKTYELEKLIARNVSGIWDFEKISKIAEEFPQVLKNAKIILGDTADENLVGFLRLWDEGQSSRKYFDTVDQAKAYIQTTGTVDESVVSAQEAVTKSDNHEALYQMSLETDNVIEQDLPKNQTKKSESTIGPELPPSNTEINREALTKELQQKADKLEEEWNIKVENRSSLWVFLNKDKFARQSEIIVKQTELFKSDIMRGKYSVLGEYQLKLINIMLSQISKEESFEVIRKCNFLAKIIIILANLFTAFAYIYYLSLISSSSANVSEYIYYMSTSPLFYMLMISALIVSFIIYLLSLKIPRRYNLWDVQIEDNYSP